MCQLTSTERKTTDKTKVIGPSRTVGSQHDTCFMSAFWRLEFGGGSYIFGKFVGPYFTAVDVRMFMSMPSFPIFIQFSVTDSMCYY